MKNRNQKKYYIIKKIKYLIIGFILVIFQILFWTIPFLVYKKYSFVYINSLLKVKDIIPFIFNYSFLRFIIGVFILIFIIENLIKSKKTEIIFFFLFSIFFCFVPLFLPIHQYRFIIFLYLFFLVFLVLVIEDLRVKIVKILKDLNHKKTKIKSLFFVFLIALFLILSVYNYNNFGTSLYYKDIDSDSFILDNNFENYIDSKNKIYFEQNINEYPFIHTNEHILALKDYKIITGLYIESSLSSQYIYPYLYNYFNNAQWLGLNKINNKNHQNKNAGIKRLEKYGIDKIVLRFSNKKAVNYLKDNNIECINCNTSLDNKYNIYDLNSQKVYFSANKPFLFLSEKESKWFNFSKYWFNDPNLFEYSLVNGDVIDSKEIINKYEKKDFSILFVTSNYANENKIFLDNIYKEYKNIIIIQNKGKVYNNYKFKDYKSKKEINNLNKYIKNNIKIDNKDLLRIKDIEIKDEKINFKVDLNNKKNNRKYVVITTNYFPNWKAYDQNENKLKVYWTTPSLMLVEIKENSKEINLKFEKKWWEDFCFYISLIIYILSILYLIFNKFKK